MPNISDLYAKADLLRKEIEHQLDNYKQEKKKLISIEDSIIANKERLRSLSETIRIHESSNDFSSLVDENRDREIASFREKLPHLMGNDK